MVNKVTLAIGKMLRQVYNQQDYKIYTQEVLQGVAQPCFFIVLKNTKIVRGFGRRYRHYLFYEIFYIMPDEKDISKYNEVGEKLSLILEYINFEDRVIRSFEHSFIVEETGLKFSFQISLGQLMVEEVENMERLGLFTKPYDF
ncbi:MAG: phage tail terminator family protein [Anaerotignaceae bacterium]